MVIDKFIDDLKPTSINKKDFKGELFKSKNLLFLKPQTFMNLSGDSLIAVKNFYKIDNSKIIVIHDDLDLPFGAIRFKIGGSSGGHNGLKSIDSKIGNDYIRVRVGIGRPTQKDRVVDYVLSDFSEEEMKELKNIVNKAADAVLQITKIGLEKVRSRYSQKGIKI